MKTEEDEAFDDLAKRQGAWGSGFPAKRAMAADKLHWSDCAVHNGPAYPAGKCDCGVAQEPVTHLWECLGRWSAYLVENGKQADCSPPSWLVDAINKATTPPLPVQEPQYEFLIDDLADWKQYVEVDNAPYGLREHVTKVLLAHGIKEKNK